MLPYSSFKDRKQNAVNTNSNDIANDIEILDNAITLRVIYLYNYENAIKTYLPRVINLT